jgi:hypothetical protein
MRRLLAGCIALALLISLPRALHAIMSYPPTDSVPVDRLISNTAKYIKAHPKDSEGFFLLGRLHSLAYSDVPRKLEVWQYFRGSDPAFTLPAVAFIEPVPHPERYTKEDKLEEKSREHLLESLKNYRRATELKPRQPLAYLGMGWILEQGALHAHDVDAPFVSPPRVASAEEWRAQALAAYRYLIAHYTELLGAISENMSPKQMVYEANQGILRLLPGPNLTPQEQAEIERVRKSVESFKNDPVNQHQIISPIIFPMRGPAPLDALLAPGRIVSFDLAGDGVPAKWPWVNADAGFLVWDPENRKQIESGRQLFGSVTWWMFWRDGYHALAALDDDGNGWLEGNELQGIAIWRDANGNGVCDPGEVIALQDAGIVRIAVRATGRTISGNSGGPSGTLFNSLGIQLRDGTSLPTYDWTPMSVQP